MIINHNMNAMNAHRNMTYNTQASGKSMEKLSSGLRINRAGDDAAGLAISEKMRGQIRGLDQASRNSQDAISMIQTGEGALNETHSILQRMRELAVQAGNDTNTTSDRGEIQKEINQLTSEINRIGNTTEFNNQKLLNGASGAGATATPGVTAVGATNASAIAGVTINAGTDNGEAGNIKIIINGDTAGAATTASFASGTLTITVASGASAADIASAINAVTASGIDFSKFTVTGTAAVTAAVAASASLAGGVTATSGTPAGSAGGAKSFTMQVGANEGQTMIIDFADMRANALGLTSTGTGGGATGTGATTAVGATNASAIAGVTINAGTDNGEAGNIKIIINGDTAGAATTASFASGTLTITVASGASAADIASAINAVTASGIDFSKFTVTGTAAVTAAVAASASLAGGVTATSGTPAAGSGAAFTNANAVSNGMNNNNVEKALDVSTAQNAGKAVTAIQAAIDQVSGERSKLGAYQNRLEHTINNLGTSSENLQAAESRIRDVDMAKEMMNFSKNNILNQAAQAMLAQANQQPQQVLQLLR